MSRAVSLPTEAAVQAASTAIRDEASRDLAVANIARLSIENHQLRQALEAASSVTRIDVPGGR